ncbi:MAG: hypothetical protein JW751_16010 [Polyangiaceae bacterium]|nr:hypothetical protein [Polyangiaceae bacterium]
MGCCLGCSGARAVAHAPPARSAVPPADDVPGATVRAETVLAGVADAVSDRGLPAGWVGGAAAVEIDRACDVVARTLLDPSAYWSIFVNTRAVEPEGRGGHGELLVRMEQGYSFVSGSYIAHVLAASPEKVVAWIDPILNLRDGRAEFELTQVDATRCRLSMFMAADLGRGLIVRVFREAIREAMLMTPELVRTYVEQR